MKIIEAHERAELMNASLTAYDFLPTQLVKIMLIDGAVFILPSSFYMKEENYYYIFTEHYNYYVFDEDDILSILYYESKK